MIGSGTIQVAAQDGWWRRRESNPRPRRLDVGAYVRVRFGVFGRRVGTGKRYDSLARLISASSYGPKLYAYPAKRRSLTGLRANRLERLPN